MNNDCLFVYWCLNFVEGGVEMIKQPEALRLAEQLRDLSTMFKTPSHEKGVCNGASFELRRLHQSEQEGWRYANELEQERKRLHEANQAMLEALKAVRNSAYMPSALVGFVDTTIAKGEQQ